MKLAITATVVTTLALGACAAHTSVEPQQSSVEQRLDILANNQQQLLNALNLMYACKADKPGAPPSTDCNAIWHPKQPEQPAQPDAQSEQPAQ